MIACLYGRDFAPFAEPVVRDLCAAAAAAGGDVQPLTIAAALADPQRRAAVHRLYVLPFDAPGPTRTGRPAASSRGDDGAVNRRTALPSPCAAAT